ncbi:hypothetical protein H4R24_004708 [Coemansia sp. RSA 988]|nr:hypothetical protein H4R24_004708 [Coemansia sp. RSA 988]
MKRGQNHNTLLQRRESFLRRGRYRWPYIKYSHYLAQPDTLASAGFVFNPVKDAPDNVQCFHCGFELTGWEATDDPFAEHYKHKPSCTFAQIHCQTRAARLGNNIEWTGWPYESKPKLTLEEREEARQNVVDMHNDVELRLATFAAGEWPHAGREGWNVTPERLAKAGFYFTPEWIGDDTATCAFCGYALAEWEPDDDPNTEHGKRSAECLFFRLDALGYTQVESTPSVKSPEKTMQSAQSEAVVVDDSDDDGIRREDRGGDSSDREIESDASSASKRPRLSSDNRIEQGADIEDASNDDEVLPNGTPPVDAINSTTAAEDREVDGMDAYHPEDDTNDTQLTETQVSVIPIPGSPGEMQIDEIAGQTDETQEPTQIEPTNKQMQQENGEWELDEEEEDMTVEEFIRACCDQKIASLEASAGHMINEFMRRAESTRENIWSYNYMEVYESPNHTSK